MKATEPIDGIFQDLGRAEIVPPSWIIRDLIVPGLTFVGGPPKSLKSTLTAAVAALTAGIKCRALPPFLSLTDKQGPVLWFSFEATAGELRHMTEEGLQVKVPHDESILVADDPWAFRLDDPDGLKRMLFWLDDRDPRLCILDPLRDFHQLEEKDSGGMNRMLRPLRQWAIEHESAFLVVHHTKKPQESSGSTYDATDLRGTGALFGIADGVLMLTPRGKDNEQTHVKAIFKRAKGWERTFTFGAYGNQGTETLMETDKTVLEAIKAQMPVTEIAEQLRVRKALIIEIVQKLERNNLVRKDGNRWLIC